MAVEQTVEWDGNALSGWIAIDGVSAKVTADRDTIRRHAPGFDDALTWEIKSPVTEIFEKMKPFFRATCKRCGRHRGILRQLVDAWNRQAINWVTPKHA